MCSAFSTSCPIKQHCSAILPWRPCNFNSCLPLNPDEREREGGRERKGKNYKDSLASFSFFCDLSFFPVIMKFTFYVGLCPFEGADWSLYGNRNAISTAKQEKRKDRHKLKHDNLTVPTQLVPAGALWCHLQQYCHWGISLPRKMRSNQSKRNGSASHSTVPLADDNLAVFC